MVGLVISQRRDSGSRFDDPFQAYGRVSILRIYETDDHQIEAARVLNVLHVYNKTFDPIFILWLFPLQLTFSYAVKDPGTFSGFHVFPPL